MSFTQTILAGSRSDGQGERAPWQTDEPLAALSVRRGLCSALAASSLDEQSDCIYRTGPQPQAQCPVYCRVADMVADPNAGPRLEQKPDHGLVGHRTVQGRLVEAILGVYVGSRSHEKLGNVEEPGGIVERSSAEHVPLVRVGSVLQEQFNNFGDAPGRRHVEGRGPRRRQGILGGKGDCKTDKCACNEESLSHTTSIGVFCAREKGLSTPGAWAGRCSRGLQAQRGGQISPGGRVPGVGAR